MESFLLRQLDLLPTLVTIIVLLWYKVKDIKDSQDDIKRKIAEIETHSDENDKKIESIIADLRKEITDIKIDKISREDAYKVWGGWKSDIKELHQSIEKLRDKIHD